MIEFGCVSFVAYAVELCIKSNQILIFHLVHDGLTHLFGKENAYIQFDQESKRRRTQNKNYHLFRLIFSFYCHGFLFPLSSRVYPVHRHTRRQRDRQNVELQTGTGSGQHVVLLLNSA